MDSSDNNQVKPDSQDCAIPAPPGISGIEPIKLHVKSSPMASPSSRKPIINAKKKLRAFSIQKKELKAAIPPVAVPKTVTSGNTTVLIGKLSSVKVTPKPEPEPDVKKPPKPPRPGSYYDTSYLELQKKNVAEIEDMKRKMELVDLGIPLGLICPTSSNEKAMPTKAMPPIKSFLDPAKVDELIREAKKARAEGKKFKFDIQKFLPDYDNPFQRKKDAPDSEKKQDDHRQSTIDKRDMKKSSRYDSRRHSDYRKDDRDRYKDDRDRYKDDRDRYKDDRDRHKDDRGKYKSKSKEKDRDHRKEDNKKNDKYEKEIKETDVNLSDYLVCDSWSLDTEDKTNSSSPKVIDKAAKSAKESKPPIEQTKETNMVKECDKIVLTDSPLLKPVKMERLKPVNDSFKFEIDPNDDEILDANDEYDQPIAEKDSKYESPVLKADYDELSKDVSIDNNDEFLESIINEIKQEDMSDVSQDKGLVEYDMSPPRSDLQEDPSQGSVTPELDDKMRDLTSQQSHYSDGYRSSESGYKSTESGYRSRDSYRSDSYRMSIEKDLVAAGDKMSRFTVDSLETWSFVLKICQPLLFRHDKNKCYKETHTVPKIWYTENPRLCACVKDRAIVYDELEMCKMGLVDRVYGCDQIPDSPFPTARTWYPQFDFCVPTNSSLQLSSEWEIEDSQIDLPKGKPKEKERSMTPQRTNDIYLDRQYQRSKSNECDTNESVESAIKSNVKERSLTPQRNEEICLDTEYQRFMQAVWPEVSSEAKPDASRSTTPVRQESRKKKKSEEEIETEEKRKAKKIKLSSEGWSQESDVEEDMEKSRKTKIIKEKEKEKVRKRKHSSSSTISTLSDSDETAPKKKKASKKKASKKSKSAKRRRFNKKYLKRLKEKKKRKLVKLEKMSDSEDEETESRKEKKAKKKKELKLKKAQKKRKSRAKSTSTSSSSSSDSSSEMDTDHKRKKKKEAQRKKNKEKKRKHSTSESSQSEELFDVNVLNNIKTERLTDDERMFSPRKQKPREIINVKELQNDFVGNNIHIKQEKEETKEIEKKIEKPVEEEVTTETHTAVVEPSAVVEASKVEPVLELDLEHIQLPEPIKITIDEPQETVFEVPQVISQIPVVDESNASQCSSQESVCSVKDPPAYEKDESHLRPSSQNSNYSFNDVISASQGQGLYQKGLELEEDKYESYEQGNYEMYEQLAMAYQSDVASQTRLQAASPPANESRRIETVVRARGRGEIKCDWRAGDRPAPAPHRPSRWGLKPGEVNIVLTGGSEQFPIQTVEPVYRIESLANRHDNVSISFPYSYDEAYMDMYGAADRLQYGDCFAPAPEPQLAPELSPEPEQPPSEPEQQQRPTGRRSLDARIHLALQNTVLGDVAKEMPETDADKDGKGILHTKTLSKSGKRVSFADGYKPGQDSDTEDPPIKKKKKARRYGCAWPCPASHPDHVPLWDALPPPPPPPPPPGSPPPPAAAAAPPAHLLRRRAAPPLLPLPPPHALLPHPHHKFDPNTSVPPFMPPEPPPSLISFH
ncbi:axoneme-associated protein mst101(2)-like isoform X3 [Galleria mellonella]|uniref:Axoneme-associated protein mst101(2)-like isoform X3 n=1 Tax=Galleria mellonella TaxID=7137 RepID=A0ABM3MNS8_GALME|nr:axoneme-associated protein mst101(2)-like isoform X3 [Galleria mellonella]